MIHAMGLILSDNDIHINTLTEKRSVAALPIAGRYRLIDFILSSMVNSGITNVGVIPRLNYSSLMDHLGSGKEWDLNRKNGGLQILPPYIGRGMHGLGEGNIDLVAAVGGHIKRSKQKHAILADGNNVLNIDFDDVMDFHLSNHSDITLVYNEELQTDRALSAHTILEVDQNNRVTGMEVRPRRPKSKKVFLNIMLTERNFLQHLIDEAVARGEHDIARDILMKKVSRLNICAYDFKGYVGCIDSIRSYYDNSMRILNENVRKELFNPNRPIYTKIKDQVPTNYGSYASVHNSLIADGCTIEGEVKNSIIFRGVYIGKCARVSNCIVMQNSVIQDGCELDHVVMDKEVIVRESGRLIGDYNYPMIIGKGAVV
jgi:glucose-1-phosphate adenylyltransferase